MERLELVIGAPLVETTSGMVSGIMAIHGADLLALFRRYGNEPVDFAVRRIRPLDETEWLLVAEPPEGLTISTYDVQIMAAEVTRFEEENDMNGAARRASSAQPSFKYDWDAMYVAVIRRIFERGLPETQAEFVGEFQEWFARRDQNGDAPDERTIRRRLNPIWRALRETA